MKAEQAFKVAMESEPFAEERGILMNRIYEGISEAASCGLLHVSLDLKGKGVLVSHVGAILRREGYKVEPGISPGEFIVSWG